MNECLKDNGGCNQICKDEKIGNSCACKDGYTLGPDRKSCRGEFGDVNCITALVKHELFKKIEKFATAF